MRPSNINTANGKKNTYWEKERDRERCSKTKERGDTTGLYKQNIISLTHTADPAKPSGLRGISCSHSFPISLTHTNTHSLSQYYPCHHTFNVAILSPALSAWLLCQERKSRKSQKHRAKGQRRKMSVRMTPPCFNCPQRKTGSMSLLGLFNLLLLLLWYHRRDTHSSSNYCHLFRSIVLGVCVSISVSMCSLSQRIYLCASAQINAFMWYQCNHRGGQTAVTDYSWFLSAFTEVMVLTETPCLSDTGQWVTYSLQLLLKAWRQETDITRRHESDVLWNAVSHQSVSKCDSTNSSCFHSGRREFCCSTGSAKCVYECISRYVFIWVLRKLILKQACIDINVCKSQHVYVSQSCCLVVRAGRDIRVGVAMVENKLVLML